MTQPPALLSSHSADACAPPTRDHLFMSSLGPNDVSAHPTLVSSDHVVVLPMSRDVSPACPHGHSAGRSCTPCSEAIRAEAISWLRDLADDHFGDNLEDLIAARQSIPDVRLLPTPQSGLRARPGPSA
jgi:hypothetical protein